jgi:hypothetical protein
MQYSLTPILPFLALPVTKALERQSLPTLTTFILLLVPHASNVNLFARSLDFETVAAVVSGWFLSVLRSLVHSSQTPAPARPPQPRLQ